MDELYVSKYFGCTEPLERADRKGNDFSNWEISDFLRALDSAHEYLVEDAKANAWELASNFARQQYLLSNEQWGEMLSANPYKEQSNE